MWCTACSWLIEEVLRRTHGILDARVFFLSDLARIKYLPHLANPRDIQSRIADLGYRASEASNRSAGSGEMKDLLLRLGISSILAMNIMMISFVLYGGFFEELGEGAVAYLSYPLWALATPSVFYGGYPIFKRAYQGLRHGSCTMDSLISVGALSAYFYSTVQMTRGSLHLYFDTASMLITLVLLGRFIEKRARSKVAAGIDELYRLAGAKARLWLNGRERWVSTESVKAGDELLVSTGERVPVDGRIISGRAGMDESFLTGESRPVRKSVEDEVLAGGLVLDGDLRIRAERMGPESSLGRMISLMERPSG